MNTDNDAPSAPIRARTWWTVAVILLVAACAQTRELTGGEKDTEAPILVSADPPDGTVRFTADRIVLRFNERVKLDRVRDRLLISPPLDKPPDVNVRAGQEVTIALRAPLKANTTYTFNLGTTLAPGARLLLATDANPASARFTPDSASQRSTSSGWAASQACSSASSAGVNGPRQLFSTNCSKFESFMLN